MGTIVGSMRGDRVAARRTQRPSRADIHQPTTRMTSARTILMAPSASRGKTVSRLTRYSFMELPTYAVPCRPGNSPSLITDAEEFIRWGRAPATATLARITLYLAEMVIPRYRGGRRQHRVAGQPRSGPDQGSQAAIDQETPRGQGRHTAAVGQASHAQAAAAVGIPVHHLPAHRAAGGQHAAGR